MQTNFDTLMVSRTNIKIQKYEITKNKIWVQIHISVQINKFYEDIQVIQITHRNYTAKCKYLNKNWNVK